MFESILLEIFADVVASAVEVNGFPYIPLDVAISSLATVSMVLACIWTGLSFLVWNILDLLKTIVRLLVTLVRRKLESKKLPDAE